MFEKLKAILKEKSSMLDLCDEIYDGKIEIVSLKEEYLLMTELLLKFENTNNSKAIMEHLKSSWEFNDYKKSCGSYISTEKINSGNFEGYDGVLTRVEKIRDYYM